MPGLHPSGLELLIGESEITCTRKDKSYDRIVAQCEVLGSDLAKMLTVTGYAFDYRKFSKGFYEPYEAQAQERKAGLWAGSFTDPVEVRKAKRGNAQ